VLTFFPVYGSGAVRPAIASSRPRAKESGLVGSKSALSDSDDEIHPFAPDEVERIVDAAQGWEKSLVALYLFTGLRRGEGLGLTWNNVFPDDGNLIVTHSVGRYGRTKPKTTASRRKVQFGPRVLAELLAQLKRRVNLLQWQMEALHIRALPSSPAIARSLTIPVSIPIHLHGNTLLAGSWINMATSRPTSSAPKSLGQNPKTFLKVKASSERRAISQKLKRPTTRHGLSSSRPAPADRGPPGRSKSIGHFRARERPARIQHRRVSAVSSLRAGSLLARLWRAGALRYEEMRERFTLPNRRFGISRPKLNERFEPRRDSLSLLHVTRPPQ
jgi:Phage integrase family